MYAEVEMLAFFQQWLVSDFLRPCRNEDVYGMVTYTHILSIDPYFYIASASVYHAFLIMICLCVVISSHVIYISLIVYFLSSFDF